MNLINRKCRAFAPLLVAILFGCQSRPQEMKIAGSLAAQVAFRDTLSYDDGDLITVLDSVSSGDSLGVWFSPRPGADRKLVGIEFFFSDTSFLRSDTLQGFVWQAPRYARNGAALQQIGAELRRFSFVPNRRAQKNSVAFDDSLNAIVLAPCADLFIGWVAGTFAVGLADTIADYQPARSYIIRKSDSTRAFAALPFDLGVRAIVQYPQAPPDTAAITFELRWDKKDADLDLYLVAPSSKDSIFWGNRTGKRGQGKLNVDDNDGFGPEKITYLFSTQEPDTTRAAELSVHYYGPRLGKPTMAALLVYRNGELCQTLGPCRLRLYDRWKVGRLDLLYGGIAADSCAIASREINVRKK